MARGVVDKPVIPAHRAEPHLVTATPDITSSIVPGYLTVEIHGVFILCVFDVLPKTYTNSMVIENTYTIYNGNNHMPLSNFLYQLKKNKTKTKNIYTAFCFDCIDMLFK